MNILMVHPHDLFSVREPWTIRVISIARELSKAGHYVVLCYCPLGGRDRVDRIDDVALVRLDRSTSPFSFVANTRRLVRLCRRADIVHLQKCQYYASLPTVMASYIAGRPLHYDWDDWEERIWYESVGTGIYARGVGYTYKILEGALPLLADSVSCASHKLRLLAEEIGVPKDSIFDSPVGADLQQFHPGLTGANVREKYGIAGSLVLYVGQLHGAQYADLFIKAARVIADKNPEARFMIVGEGFLEEKLKRLSRDLGLNRRLLFTGGMPHEQIPHHMAAADVCVAAFRETEVVQCKSPLKIVEYLASGKPIVASAVGDVKEMVGDAGILVEPGDHIALAKGVLKLLGEQDLRRELGQRARRRAEEIYNWRRTASALMTAYERITAS